MFFDQVLSISRLQKDVDNTDKESYQPNLALQSVSCNIQPASPEQVAMMDGLYSQSFICFTTESGIMVGDKAIQESNGQLFRVKGREDWDMTDLIPHIELTLVRFEDEEVR